MIVLDTNVLSELVRPSPLPAVESWIGSLSPTSVFISAITEAELRHGLALLPRGRQQQQLLVQVEAIPVEDFAGCILPFDSSAASAYADIAAAR